MGLRLTTSENVTALFDSVSGWAFGPTFDTEEDAEEFLAWCASQGVEDGDVRAISLQELEGMEKRYYEERRQAGEDV